MHCKCRFRCMNNGSNLSGAKAPLKGRLCRATFLYFGTLLSFSENVKTKLTFVRVLAAKQSSAREKNIISKFVVLLTDKVSVTCHCSGHEYPGTFCPGVAVSPQPALCRSHYAGDPNSRGFKWGDVERPGAARLFHFRSRRSTTPRAGKESDMSKRSETGQDVLTTTAGPVVTLDQVKDALAKVAAHSQCSEKMANTIAINSGGVINASRDPGRLPSEAWETIKPKKFERVLRKCESVLENAAAEDMVATERKRPSPKLMSSASKSLHSPTRSNARARPSKSTRPRAIASFRPLQRSSRKPPLAKAAGMTMKALKLKYVGDRLGDTRFKLALRIARGLITHEQATAAILSSRVRNERRPNLPLRTW